MGIVSKSKTLAAFIDLWEASLEAPITAVALGRLCRSGRADSYSSEYLPFKSEFLCHPRIKSGIRNVSQAMEYLSVKELSSLLTDLELILKELKAEFDLNEAEFFFHVTRNTPILEKIVWNTYDKTLMEDMFLLPAGLLQVLCKSSISGSDIMGLLATIDTLGKKIDNAEYYDYNIEGMYDEIEELFKGSMGFDLKHEKEVIDSLKSM